MSKQFEKTVAKLEQYQADNADKPSCIRSEVGLDLVYTAVVAQTRVMIAQQAEVHKFQASILVESKAADKTIQDNQAVLLSEIKATNKTLKHISKSLEKSNELLTLLLQRMQGAGEPAR
jgi:hypothetical protein